MDFQFKFQKKDNMVNCRRIGILFLMNLLFFVDVFSTESILKDEEMWDVGCYDEESKLVKEGVLFFVMKNREPKEMNISNRPVFASSDLEKLNYICFYSKNYQTKIVPYRDDLVKGKVMEITNIRRNRVPQKELFPIEESFLVVKGYINITGIERILISSLNFSKSIYTVNIEENGFPLSFNINSPFFLKLLPDEIFVLFRNDVKHLPYVALAKKTQEGIISKTYVLEKPVDFITYDFRIKTPAKNQQIYGSQIVFELDNFSFDPEFGRIDFKIQERDSVVFTIPSKSEKEPKFVLKNAYNLLEKNENYTFRASYFSYLTNKEIVVKESGFSYRSKAPTPVSLIKSDLLKSKYHFNDTLFIAWHPSSDPDEEDTVKYELIVCEIVKKDKKQHPGRIVVSDITNETKACSFIDTTKFEVGKNYGCCVNAVDKYGVLTVTSDTLIFQVIGPKPKIFPTKSIHAFPSVIQFKYHRVVKDQHYDRFVDSIETKSNFDDYSQIVVSKSFDVADKLDLDVKFLLPSPLYLYMICKPDYQPMQNLGLGVTLQPLYRLTQKGSVGFSFLLPSLSAVMWGQGMKDRINGFFETKLGVDVDVGRNISFCGSWIPFYITPYKTIHNEVKNFVASGWQIGVGLIIPNEVMPEFTVPLINWTVDAMRCSIEYNYSRITSREGVKIKDHTIGVGYRF